MGSVSTKFGAWLALALAPCAILDAQAPDSKAEPESFVFRTETSLVDVHATVIDAQGRLVTGLPESAFTVYENGVRQQIKVFRREDVPVSLGLAIDNSASMRDKRAKVASAALALVAASNPEDEVFILNFSDQASLEADFTNNIKTLEAALKTINSRGETAMRDAIRMGIEHLKHGSVKEKKVMLVVTDGEDNKSVDTLPHLIQSAQQEGVLIYAIGLLSDDEPLEAERAKRALDALTLATGGQAWYPHDLSEVEGIAQEVAHDIRNQYTLGYVSSNPVEDGTFRKISVVVDAPDKPVVRTRAGYYATPIR